MVLGFHLAYEATRALAPGRRCDQQAPHPPRGRACSRDDMDGAWMGPLSSPVRPLAPGHKRRWRGLSGQSAALTTGSVATFVADVPDCQEGIGCAQHFPFGLA